jgi:phenylpropionate dioxygenase-like ring-hydroxylating dioxygenase large terminal subunit
MMIEPKSAKLNLNSDPLTEPEVDLSFHWQNCWYPVGFLQDLPKNRAYSFSLYDEPFVLFKNHQGKLVCLSDRCSHRAAKLSDGQIIDGKIECLYHGWQFGADGECLHIPQLPPDAQIPAKACIKSFTVVEKQGMIWVWPGQPEKADENNIPMLPDMEKPGFVHTDKISDLPYDQSYFLENVLDPAHVDISHDGSQGNRENAQPLDMEISNSSVAGFKGRFRNTREPNQPWRNMDFIAPNLVLLTFTIEKRGWSFGLALYSIPLGQGRCRVLTRSYRNFFAWKLKLTPRWWIHLSQSKILEEDMELVQGQAAEVERLGQGLQQIYLPLKSSDLFVIEYRKWLDQFGSSLPFYQGYCTAKHPASNDTGKNGHQFQDDRENLSLGRLHRHTQLCSSCSQAYQVTRQIQTMTIGVAILMTAIAIIMSGTLKVVAVATAILAVSLAAIAGKLQTHFERSYTRHTRH